MSKYGSIKYGSDIYGNVPPIVSFFVEGANISGKILRSPGADLEITDSINQIKTTEIMVKE